MDRELQVMAKLEDGSVILTNILKVDIPNGNFIVSHEDGEIEVPLNSVEFI